MKPGTFFVIQHFFIQIFHKLRISLCIFLLSCHMPEHSRCINCLGKYPVHSVMDYRFAIPVCRIYNPRCTIRIPTIFYSPVKKLLCSLNIRSCFFFLFLISRKRPLRDQSRPFQTMPRCCPIWFELIIRMSLVALQIRFPVACIMFRDPPFVI